MEEKECQACQALIIDIQKLLEEIFQGKFCKHSTTSYKHPVLELKQRFRELMERTTLGRYDSL